MGKVDGERNNILLTVLLTIIIVFGSVFPYVYGRGLTTTYLDVRVQYLFDYFLFIGIGIACLRFGKQISSCCLPLLQGKNRWLAGVLIIIIMIPVALFRNNYSKIVPLEIIKNRMLISESYAYWNGIISEIEDSEESDIIITRDEEPMWTPYFLYCGLVEEEVYDLPLDAAFSMDIIMPNVYYGKESIRYIVGE